jgi:hypothetical protein
MKRQVPVSQPELGGARWTVDQLELSTDATTEGSVNVVGIQAPQMLPSRSECVVAVAAAHRNAKSRPQKLQPKIVCSHKSRIAAEIISITSQVRSAWRQAGSCDSNKLIISVKK